MPLDSLSQIDDLYLPCEQVLGERDNHHLYHASSAFRTSGFTEAAVLVIDGQGPAGDHLSTTTIWSGNSTGLTLVEDLNPGDEPFAKESLGHFYTAITALAGFDTLFAEGRAMALASYGRPSLLLHKIRKHAGARSDGTFFVDPHFIRSIFSHTLGRKFYNWGEPTRAEVDTWHAVTALMSSRTEWPNQDHMNVAFAGQSILEEIATGLAERALRLTGMRRLCLAGGVALNCVANGKLRSRLGAGNVYVAPYPADDGQALGKLLHQISIASENYAEQPMIRSVYLGPQYTESEIQAAVERVVRGGRLELVQLEDPLSHVAKQIADGKVVGWFQGRSELGPRALGHRSLLADPREVEMRQRLNDLKRREWFRPVAPIVKQEVAHQYFETKGAASPFMSFALAATELAKRETPAVVHVDGTARVQTLNAQTNSQLYLLLELFERVTGVPMLINTSFNKDGEPMVETVEDACEAAIDMGLDLLVIEGQVLVPCHVAEQEL